MEQDRIKEIKKLSIQNHELNSWFHNLFNIPSNTSYFIQQKVAKPIEVALDTIGDTLTGISAYMSSEKEHSNESGCYLEVYGLLQLIFVQQDALRYLTCLIKKAGSLNSFDFNACLKNCIISESSTKIRELRNTLIGHPQDYKTTYWGQIVRMELKKYNFTAAITNKKTMETNWQEYEVLELIQCQLLNSLEVLKQAKEIVKNNTKIKFV